MRAVLDTNVLVRALMNPDGTWGDIVRRQGEFVHLTSPELINEFLRVIEQPRLRRRLGPGRSAPPARRALEILSRAEVVVPASTPAICRDPEDDKFFACAVAGQAAYIVSEDEDILAIEEHEGVRTIRASAFLRVLDAARQG